MALSSAILRGRK